MKINYFCTWIKRCQKLSLCTFKNILKQISSLGPFLHFFIFLLLHFCFNTLVIVGYFVLLYIFYVCILFFSVKYFDKQRRIFHFFPV